MQNLELGFIGFGLIGGSIARSIKKKNGHYKIKVYTRRKNPHLEQGVEEGVIDELLYDIGEPFSSCDIIFLCAPVLKNLEFLPLLKPLVKPSCIITDVGSVKGSICRTAASLGLDTRWQVPKKPDMKILRIFYWRMLIISLLLTKRTARKI